MEPKKTHILCLVVLGLIFLPTLAISQETYVYAPEPGKQIYFGHVSFSEIAEDADDALVFRKGEDVPEKAVLNFPLGPGDIIQTSSRKRCEIQFDTGTVIRLDLDTRLRIEAILAQSLSSNKKISNLVLEKGRIYVMYKRYNRPEIFQVITTNAAFKLEHNSVCFIQTQEKSPSDIWVDQGKVNILYGPHAQKIENYKLKKSHQMRVGLDNTLEPFKDIRDPGFASWNQDMNENFLALHATLSKLPKPIQRYSPAVTYFAQKYSQTYGEWLYHDLLGYVWKPHMNNYYPQTPWQPMVFGQWRELVGQMFWVPEEPWGWVPYHLGVWHWDKNKGWLWIPGGAFAPVWAQWHAFFGGSLFGWSPLSLYSWCPPHLMYAAAEYEERPDEFVYRGNPLLLNPNPTARIPESGSLQADPKPKRTLGGPTMGLPRPVYPLPDSMKKPFKNVRKALENKVPALMDSIRSAPQTLYLVQKPNLDAPRLREKLIEPGGIPSFGKEGDRSYRQGMEAARTAVNNHWSNRVQRRSPHPIDNAGLQSGVARVSIDSMQPDNLDSHEFKGRRSFEGRGGGSRKNSPEVPASIGLVMSVQPRHDPVRFRDWNPDVKNFTREGVAIHYDSRENRVRVPQWEDSNGELAPGRGSSRGGVRIQPNSGYSGSKSSGSDSGNSSRSSAGSSRGSSSSGSGGTRQSSGSAGSGGSKGSSGTTKK